MAVNPSRTKLAFDKSALTLLRDPAAAAINTATTTSETGISLKELRSAYWHNFEIPHGVMRVGVVVMTYTGGTATLNIQVDDTANFSDSPVTIASFVLPSAVVGFYEFDIDSKSIPQLD